MNVSFISCYCFWIEPKISLGIKYGCWTYLPNCLLNTQLVLNVLSAIV